MRTYTKESLITALKSIRDQGWIETRRRNNDGGVGNTLEDLLGLEENNLPLPNAAEWELKAQKLKTTALITLFHSEPSPTAYKFVPKILLPLYGWPHQEAGKKYSYQEMSFRQTINASRYSSRGFSVKVDRENQKILIDFRYDCIDKSKHQGWSQKVLNSAGKGNLEPQPYWGFDDLFHKAGTKLHNCFLVQADTKREQGILYFHYQKIYMLRAFDKSKFIDAIEDGKICVEFDARTGHNHGTKFRLRKDILIDLYADCTEY
ncbi:MAG: MvaI/BcnI family restriction endonuclease [Microcystaceae cyanobacterium]